MQSGGTARAAAQRFAMQLGCARPRHARAEASSRACVPLPTGWCERNMPAIECVPPDCGRAQSASAGASRERRAARTMPTSAVRVDVLATPVRAAAARLPPSTPAELVAASRAQLRLQTHRAGGGEQSTLCAPLHSRRPHAHARGGSAKAASCAARPAWRLAGGVYPIQSGERR